MKKISLIVVLFFSIVSFSQQSYKYVIVPAKFEFLSKENQYNVNSLTKSFFDTEGFTTFYNTDNLPENLAKNRCIALQVYVGEENKMFSTNITIQVKDCSGKILVESKKGTSREKDFQKAYNEAFRMALTSLKGQLNIETEEKKPIVLTEVAENPNEIEFKNDPALLVAIPVENGYKLVDSDPKTVLTIQKTSSDDIFMAQKGNQQGTFLKKMNGWFFEYYQDGKLISEKVNVKF